MRPMRTIVSKLRLKLCDDAEDPKYIFTELRVGYGMPKGRFLNRRRRDSRNPYRCLRACGLQVLGETSAKRMRPPCPR